MKQGCVSAAGWCRGRRIRVVVGALVLAAGLLALAFSGAAQAGPAVVGDPILIFPAVSSVSLDHGTTYGGTKVTIKGSYLGSTSAVTFGDTPATSFTVVSSTEVTAVSPAHDAGLVYVRVFNSGGLGSATGAGSLFTYYKRVQETSSLLSYKTAWSTPAGVPSYSGGTMRTTSENAPMTFRFTGTAFRLICTKGPGFGKLKVTVDWSKNYYVDLYDSGFLFQKPVLTKTGLTDGTHVVVLNYTGGKNDASNSAMVNIDAVEVAGTPAPAYSRYQEDSPLLSYQSPWGWAMAGAYSGGYIRITESHAPVTVKFYGTGFKVIAATSTGMGKMKVTIDGSAQSSYPDLFTPNYVYYQQVVFSKTGLSLGIHKVVLDYSGYSDALSSGDMVDLDALDIQGTLLQAP